MSQIKRKSNEVSASGPPKKGSVKNEGDERGGKEEEKDEAEADSESEGTLSEAKNPNKIQSAASDPSRTSKSQNPPLDKNTAMLTQIHKEMNERIESLEEQFKMFSTQNRLLVGIIQSRELL